MLKVKHVIIIIVQCFILYKEINITKLMASLKNNYKYNNITVGFISVEHFIDPKLGQGRDKEKDIGQIARELKILIPIIW